MAHRLLLPLPKMLPAELREILQKTHEMVTDSARWTERNFAEDEAGRWVPVGSPNAVRFNLAGAMIRCAGSLAHHVTQAFAELLCQAPSSLGTWPCPHVRDLTRAQALELLQWALERLDSLSREEPNVAHASRG